MSVLEKAVANRVLDFKEKEAVYRMHIIALAGAKKTVDTDQPVTRAEFVSQEIEIRSIEIVSKEK